MNENSRIAKVTKLHSTFEAICSITKCLKAAGIESTQITYTKFPSYTEY